MIKIKTKAVFKEYNQQQIQLLPPSLEELIPENLILVLFLGGFLSLPLTH